MALIMKQQDSRSELQKRVAAELQEKAKQARKDELPDGVDDSAFIKGSKQTTSLAWVWLLIAVLAVGVVIWLILSSQ